MYIVIIVGIVRHWTTWSDDRNFHALVALVATRSGSAALSTGLAPAGPGSRWDGTPALEKSTSEDYETCWLQSMGVLPRLRICWFPWRSESGMRGDAQREMKPNEKKTLWSQNRDSAAWKRSMAGSVSFYYVAAWIPGFSGTSKKVVLFTVLSDLGVHSGHCLDWLWAIWDYQLAWPLTGSWFKFAMSQCAVMCSEKSEVILHAVSYWDLQIRATLLPFMRAPKSFKRWKPLEKKSWLDTDSLVTLQVFRAARCLQPKSISSLCGRNAASWEHPNLTGQKFETLWSSLWGLQAPSLPPSRLATNRGRGSDHGFMGKGWKAQDCKSIL